MIVERGEVWWANLADPIGSEPGYRRPVVIVQADDFNRSQLRTAIVVTMFSNLQHAMSAGNVLIPAIDSGLPKDSVANVTQVSTIDRRVLSECIGRIPANLMDEIDEGLRLVMSL